MEEKLIKANEVKLWTVTQGKGIPVMLCNGGPGCCDYLGPVAEMIENQAHVIRFEQRGCGRSDDTESYGIGTCISDLEEIRKKYGIEKWIIGGHSWGADLALAYTLTHPGSTLGLIHMSGTGIQNDRDWKEAHNKGVAEKLETMPAFDYPINKKVNQSVIKSWRQFIKRPMILKEISEITVPSLFVYGSKDIRPSWAVEQIAHLIPNSEFKMIDGAGHYLWLTHEDHLKENLRSYLEQF
jgi:proline iminopeptidase